MNPHFVLFLVQRDPIPSSLHNETGKFGPVDLSVRDEEIGKTGVGDKLLLSIDLVPLYFSPN